MDNNDFICYDREIEPTEKIKNMTEEELEAEFYKRFGDIIKQKSE